MVALLLRNWSHEQEVIVPSYTFSSTAAAFARAGFKVVFSEINPNTMMIDLEDAERKITTKTTALIGVHYGGDAFDAVEARQLCEKNGIILIEDAAQAFGGSLYDSPIGSFGSFSTFSFHETKNLHSGLGGALVINDLKYLERATCIWERGTNRQDVFKGIVDKYSWVEIGGSFYPTELQAAFLFAQLEKSELNIQQRQCIHEGYVQIFKEAKIPKISLPVYHTNYQTNYHAFWVIFSSIEECDFIRQKLAQKEIYAYIGYVPLHSSAVGRAMGNKTEDLPITEEYSQRLLRLPLHNNMTPTDSMYVAENILEAINDFRGKI